MWLKRFLRPRRVSAPGTLICALGIVLICALGIVLICALGIVLICALGIVLICALGIVASFVRVSSCPRAPSQTG